MGVLWVLVGVVVGAVIVGVLLRVVFSADRTSMLCTLRRVRHVEEDRLRAQGWRPPE